MGNELPKALELAAPAQGWTGFRGCQRSRSGEPLSKHARKEAPRVLSNTPTPGTSSEVSDASPGVLLEADS